MDIRRLYADHSIAENRFTAVCAVDHFISGGFICRASMVPAIITENKNVIKVLAISDNFTDRTDDGFVGLSSDGNAARDPKFDAELWVRVTVFENVF